MVCFDTSKYLYACCRIGLDLRLDVLDTGGSYVFPAMRSLAIKSADGFVLVCAADDPSSLEVSSNFDALHDICTRIRNRDQFQCNKAYSWPNDERTT